MSKRVEKNLLHYYGFSEEDKKNYPVIAGILEQLTPKRMEQEIRDIQKIELPSELQKWVREYEKVGERNEFLWKWMYKAVQLVTLATVSKKYQKSLLEIKTLIIMFITLLDDIADKGQEKILLNELLKIPSERGNVKFSGLSSNKKRYLISTIKLWDYIKKAIKRYPRYKEFKDIFEYDILQVLNEMRYAYLVNNNPCLINKTEYWIYLPFNMQGFVSYTVDLMCAPKFNTGDLGCIREIAWRTQKMAKIGNWISTWEREIKENDFTSGVFAYGIDAGIISAKELKKGNNLKITKKIKRARIEKRLLNEWEQCHHKINSFGKKNKSVEVQKILDGSKKFLILHLVSRSYI